MKVDFNVPITDLNGTVIKTDSTIDNATGDVVDVGKGEPIILGKIFANILSGDAHTDTGIEPSDAYEWALAIRKGLIDLTTAQQDSIKAFIKKSIKIPASAKGQLLACLRKTEK